MKACVLDGVGKFSCKDLPAPRALPGEVLLHVRACGICSSDLDRVFRTGAYHHPIILGHEISGQIVAAGDGVDSSLVGRDAVVFPLKPCMNCEYCKNEHYAQCISYDYFGSRCNGGFAEYLSVPLWNILPFSGLPYTVAALCEPAAVALHALSLLKGQTGSLCVVGTGTVGILCGMFARLYGHDVTFVSRNSQKSEFLRAFGFENTVSADSSHKFDACIECVGTNAALEAAIQLVRSRGEVVLVGNPAGDMHLEKAVYWRVLRSELTLYGSWNSSYRRDWLAALANLGKIQAEKLITHKFHLTDGMLAMQVLADKGQITVKGVYENE